jgi:DNA-binding response OmpR family regulator
MKKILYVEDNLDTAEAVKIILSNAGYKIDHSSCGIDALEKAKQHYDVILLDIMLPDMSGWDIYEKLKNRVEKTKFAFLSAIPVSAERMKELKKAGVSDYITKPFTKADLIERIRKMINDSVLKK